METVGIYRGYIGIMQGLHVLQGLRLPVLDAL